MMRHIALLGLLLLPGVASAQETGFPAASCHDAVERAFGREQREYRAVLLGQPTTTEASMNDVRYDKDGRTWIKTGNDEWSRYDDDPKGEGQTQGNDAMESAAEFPARRGWLEVRQAQTSELLPPVLQSFRALRCRAASVCARVSGSIGADSDGAELTIEIPGCVEVKTTVMPECRVQDDENAAHADVVTFAASCESMEHALVQREKEILKFLIAYDAAQRSLYQFLGIIDTFLTTMQTTLLEPVWQAVRAFQSLDRIPCFSSQCEQ